MWHKNQIVDIIVGLITGAWEGEGGGGRGSRIQ